MASFTSASAALEAAVAIQKALADHNEANAETAIRVRIGLNAGEPVAEDEDLACGPGNLAAAAAARGADVVGVDIAKEMVAVARRRNPAIPFHRAPAEELPFGDRSLDAVCAGFAMHHFPDPAAAAVEVFRVLRPAGEFSFTVWSGDADKSRFFHLVSEAVKKHGTLDGSLPEGPENFALADETLCESLLAKAGFEGMQRSEITVDLELPGPESILDILGTTVRMRAIVEAQTEPHSA